MSITKQKTKHIDELYFEQQQWSKELQFYKDELIVFKRRLDEVAGMYSNKEVLARLEHFQNQFILQEEVTDNLLHDLHEHQKILANTAKEYPVAIDHRAFSDHPALRERMHMFLKIYRDLKNEYMRYLSSVM